MENVVSFNTELSGLYESKPPISKAKMAAITKSAMRAIKFYKHVVQSVEKFILKCRPEYKVPGLYVIDSIVRQSRHQFGTEKDVFAPRFARNIKETFANLFRCAPEDKSRIIRVLNLWQKNSVFAPDVIQPLFDLADPNHPIYQMAGPGGSNATGGGVSMSLADISSTSNGLNSTMGGGGMDISMSGMSSGGGAGAGADDKMMPDLSSMSHEKAKTVLDASTLRQLEHMQHYLKRQTGNAAVATTSSASASAAKSSNATGSRDHLSYQCCVGPDELADGGGGVPAACCCGAGGGGGGGVGGACCNACCPVPPGVGTTAKTAHRHHSGDAFSKYTNDGHHHHHQHHQQQQLQQQHGHSHNQSHSHAHVPHLHSHGHSHHHYRGGGGGGAAANDRDYRVGAGTASAVAGAGDDDSDHDHFGGGGGGGHAAVDDDLDDDDDDAMAANSPTQHPHTSSTSNLLDNNNLKQLLNDPNVLMQLKTLQNFQKFKQQEDSKYKSNDLRMQEEAFEKHLHNMIKATGGVQSSGVGGLIQDPNFDNKEVEFVSEEHKIEVINLDGNDSRSQSPDRDRYKRRRSSRSRSRSRERGGGGGGRGGSDRRRGRSRSRSRSRSPRSSQRRRSSRERDRNKDKDREHERERRKKGLPDLRKEHLSVCSTTLWVGHLSKLVYQEELSDTFGEYGDIVSIDQIVPRGCAFIVMNRRQDAHKAMQSLKNCKLQGRAITISWAAGKGVKSKEWKDFWDLELGCTYVPWNKLDKGTDFDSLEEGGMFDEDSMPGWMKDKINQLKSTKEKVKEMAAAAVIVNPTAMPPQPTPNMLFGIDTTQPPPGPPPHGAPPPPMMQMVPGQFQMAPPMGGPPRMLGGPMGMPLSGIPMPPNMVPGMPPPHMMMPAGMMPPGFPPMPGHGGPMGPPPMGMPPGQYAPPGPGPVNAPPSAPATVAPPFPVANLPASDDQMDIEMDEDDGPAGVGQPPALNFNQPPPPMMFGGNGGPPAVGVGSGDDMFSRERNRAVGGGGAGSRWGGRGADEVDPQDVRWRENGTGPGGLTNFNGRPPGGPMNMPPMDLNNPDMVMNDFDNRGGQRGGPGNSVGPRGGGGNGGDFFQNVQPNRFNQPTSLMQMRIPPPNSFGGPRMGGPGGGAGGGPGGGGPPGMFIRGQGPNGGRQQGPGFFNPRNPFDRDGGARGSRGGGRGGRGARVGGGGSQGNWSGDDDDDNRSDNFKRRGAGGNRFRDRDDSDDWHSGGGGGGSRERGGGGGGRRGRHGRDRDRDFRSGSRERRHTSPGDKANAGAANTLNTPPHDMDRTENWDTERDNVDANATKTLAPTTTTAGAVAADASTRPADVTAHDDVNTASGVEQQQQSNEVAAKEAPPQTQKKKHNNPFAVAMPTVYSERPSQQPADGPQPTPSVEETARATTSPNTNDVSSAPPPPPPMTVEAPPQQQQQQQQEEAPQAITPQPVVAESSAHSAAAMSTVEEPQQQPSPPHQQPSPPPQQQQEQEPQAVVEQAAAAADAVTAAATPEHHHEEVEEGA